MPRKLTYLGVAVLLCVFTRHVIAQPLLRTVADWRICTDTGCYGVWEVEDTSGGMHSTTIHFGEAIYYTQFSALAVVLTLGLGPVLIALAMGGLVYSFRSKRVAKHPSA